MNLACDKHPVDYVDSDKRYVPSNSSMDPFLHLISLLRPRAALWHQIDAVGRWAISFRKREDVLFCSVLRGSCQLVRPGRTTLPLSAGDFVLIRTCAPFRFASDEATKAETSERVFAKASSGTRVKLGSGKERPVKLSGGASFSTRPTKISCSDFCRRSSTSRRRGPSLAGSKRCCN